MEDYVIVIGVVLCFSQLPLQPFQCIKMRPAAPAVLLLLLLLIQALRVLRAPPASLSKPLCVYLTRTHTCILMCLQCGVTICHCGCLFFPSLNDHAVRLTTHSCSKPLLVDLETLQRGIMHDYFNVNAHYNDCDRNNCISYFVIKDSTIPIPLYTFKYFIFSKI